MGAKRKKNEYLLVQESMLCVSAGVPQGEGVKSNKAVLRRGVFDQRSSKQAASPA